MLEEEKPNFNSLFQTVGKIDGKVDGILTRLDKINGRLDSHGKEIDILQDCTANIKGRAAGAGAVAGFIAGAISVIFAVIAFFKKQF